MQGGYFFLMFFMISFTAVKAIANAIKYVILSTIKYNTPFARELKQPPPFLYI